MYDKMCGCFNCGSYFLFSELLPDETGEPSLCPECCSSDWAVFDPEVRINTRLVRRKNGFRKAIRRRNICKAYGTGDWYNNLHQYADNKIHCSCPMCRAKTSKKKMRKAYGHGGKNWKTSDRKRLEELHYELFEYRPEKDDLK